MSVGKARIVVTGENTTALQVEPSRATSFVTKVMADAGAAITCGLCVLGHRFGLFTELRTTGSATSLELARRTKLKERYVREWLSLLAGAGYLEYDLRTDRFFLSSEHASILGQMKSVYRSVPAFFAELESIREVFQRDAGSIPVSDTDFPSEIETTSAGSYAKYLLQWLPAIGGLQASLENGAKVADVGCGCGGGLVRMALAFPKSRFVGYELFSPLIPRAKANAEAAGVADRVQFENGRSFRGNSDYDLITSFDVLYDHTNAVSLLRTIRAALKPEGTYLIVEIQRTQRREREEAKTTLEGVNVFVCTPAPVARTQEMLLAEEAPECKLSDLCAEAGFSKFVRLA